MRIFTQRKRMGRAPAIALATALALVLTACADDTPDEEAEDPVAEETDAADGDGEEQEEPQAFSREVTEGSGEGISVAYLSGGDSIPFVKIVTDSVLEFAGLAGLDIASCDGELDPAIAQECARSFAVQDLEAVANWQFSADAAPEVCEAYGNLPTVAIDAPQPPCQVTFVGADNEEAGRIAGEGLAGFIQSEFDCEYDAYVSLEIPQLPDVNEARMGGMRSGFESVCGEIADGDFIQIDTGAGEGGPTEVTRQQFGDILTTLPDAEVIVVASVNDDALLGAFAAAETAGVKDNVYGAAHGADPTSWPEIRNNPNWVGDVAYFPERYGELVVAALIAIAKGQEVPEEILVDHVFVTAENIDTAYPESVSE